MDLTYRSLVRPIPAKHNLANVASEAGSPVCDICKAVVPDRTKAKRNTIETDYQLIDRYPDFPLLKRSADSGCPLCWVIRKALRRNWASRPMEEWGVGPLSELDPSFAELLDAPWDCSVNIYNLKFLLDSFIEAPAESRISTSLQGGVVTGMTLEFGPVTPAAASNDPPLHQDISQILRFKVFDSVGQSATVKRKSISNPSMSCADYTDLDTNEEICRRRLPSPQSLSDENVRMIQRWISDCITSHVPCRSSPLPTPWLPTRLLDVGSDVKNCLPRLVETKTLSASGIKFAALSHMWGDVEAAPPLQAMKCNYYELTQGISIGRLPRNFADAVETCRRLEIGYIWIDSLCILQDSTEDWRREAETMHKVYKHALITIAA